MASPTAQNSHTLLLELRQITKSFGNLRANDHIDLEIRPGEIHALLGENGAGKTTLMNILYGLYHPDEGEIRLRGNVIQINSPRDAIQHRIGMIHQHFMLIPNFSVVENIVMGLPSPREPLLDLSSAARQIKTLAEKFGLHVDPFALVRDLPVGVQQRVEILKALYRGADLLILDEPTAVLSPLEIKDFFKVLKSLVQQGLSVIFITHKLDEVFSVCDRVTILRRGKRIGTLDIQDATQKNLAEMMVGREVFLDVQRKPVETGATVLELREVCARGKEGIEVLKNIRLTVAAGEVLGIAGIDGNGQQELTDVVAGLLPLSSGKIYLKGTDLTTQKPKARIDAGLSYIPADRHSVGLVLNFSIEENLLLKSSDRPPYARRGVLDLDQARSSAEKALVSYDIRASSPDELARSLSGGNQQKVILAREIESQPILLMAVQPTRGLDIGATEDIRRRILEQRAKQVAVLLVSTDLEEILALSDRVAVMFRGEIMGIVPGSPDQLKTISQMMLGKRIEELV